MEGQHAKLGWTYPTRSNIAPDNSLLLAAGESNDANYFVNSHSDPTNYLTPVGLFSASPGPYGTYDMGGVVWQWNEAIISGTCRGVRGGTVYYLRYADFLASFCRGSYYPADEGDVGFRVASVAQPVPEPGSIGLLLAAAGGLLIWRLRRG
jgi:formylglycine-generating enzyme